MLLAAARADETAAAFSTVTRTKRKPESIRVIPASTFRDASLDTGNRGLAGTWGGRTIARRAVVPALAVQYDAWVRTMPRSYASRLARGIYLRYVGKEARGSALQTRWGGSLEQMLDSEKQARAAGLSDLQLRYFANMIVAERRWVQTGGRCCK